MEYHDGSSGLSVKGKIEVIKVYIALIECFEELVEITYLIGYLYGKDGVKSAVISFFFESSKSLFGLCGYQSDVHVDIAGYSLHSSGCGILKDINVIGIKEIR